MLGIKHWIALLVAAGLALVATTAVVIPGKGAERPASGFLRRGSEDDAVGTPPHCAGLTRPARAQAALGSDSRHA